MDCGLSELFRVKETRFGFTLIVVREIVVPGSLKDVATRRDLSLQERLGDGRDVHL